MHDNKGLVPEVQTADSCSNLIGPRQCNTALGGPATSTATVDLIKPPIRALKQAEGCISASGFLELRTLSTIYMLTKIILDLHYRVDQSMSKVFA